MRFDGRMDSYALDAVIKGAGKNKAAFIDVADVDTILLLRAVRFFKIRVFLCSCGFELCGT